MYRAAGLLEPPEFSTIRSDISPNCQTYNLNYFEVTTKQCFVIDLSLYN